MITSSQKKPKRSPNKNPDAKPALRTSRTKRGTQHVQRITSRKTVQGQPHVDIHEHREHGTLKESLLALEPRIMFDGAALITGADVTNDQLTQQETDATASSESKVQDTSSSTNSEDTLFESLKTLDTPSDRREIVFIDTAVEDYQTLIEGIDSSAEVVLLDSTRDGIEQMAEILDGRMGIDAIHIVSHGDQGELRLSTGRLTLESMANEYSDELSLISQSLTENADFLIYGCNFGEGQTGQAASARLAQLTGADVAASIDDTGYVQLGGDWDLEYETGNIETQIVFSQTAQENWEGLMAWYNTNWEFRKEITIDSSQVPSDQTNFKFLVSLGSDADLAANARSDGFDILFTDSDGTTKLDHEIETFVSGTGELAAWVEIPTLTSSSDKNIYMYYGYASASDQQNTAGVWDANYDAVWHLNESPANGVAGHDDSTGSSNDGTPQGFNGTAPSTTNDSGKIGGADTFDGTDDSVGIPDSAIWTLDDTANYTWEMWVNPDDLSTEWTELWGQTDSSGRGVSIYAHTTSNSNLGPVTNGISVGWDESASDKLGVHSTNNVLTTGAWHHVTVTYDGSLAQASRFTIYVDGVDVTDGGDINSVGTLSGLNPTSIAIGGNPVDPPTWYDGTIDEVRVSSVARSADWVATQYNNQNAPGSFFTLNSASGPPMTVTDGDTTATFQEGSGSYAGTQDTYINEDDPSTSYGSATQATADADHGNGNEAQSLIRFDNLFGTGPGQIPVGATIISASIEFEVPDPSSSGATVSLHRMLTNWTEGSTWNSLSGGIQTNGTDAASTADAIVSDPVATGPITLTGLESTLQAWSDGATNYGWVITNDNTNGWDFESSENAAAGLRPKLIVEYRTSGGDTSTGLTGHWTFDANANDSSGNSYNGTLTGDASIDSTDLTDQVGAGKLSLDGTDDYVDLSAHVGDFDGLSEGTISAWIKTTGTDGTIFSISDDNNTDSRATLLIDVSGQVEFSVFENDSALLELRSTAVINDGAWHHVAVTVSSSGNALYIDGEVASVTYDTGNSSTTSFFDDISGIDSLNIGRDENDSGGRLYFDGLLDDVRVYNQGLSLADIAAVAAEAPLAYNDTATTTKNTAVNIDLTANDTDLDSETISVLDVGNPTNGTVVNNDDGTVTYTPGSNYTGTDSFTYLAADLDDTVSYWRLDGNGTDAVGSNDGTLTGTTTVTGVYGDALGFDEVDDKVVVSDFAINNEFSLSFKFKVDDNSGSDYQYFYSHGSTASSNSLNIYIGESGSAEANLLRTRLLDTNDSGDSSALEFDVSNIIGDGQWHTYTLTVASGGGSKVYLDGILKNSDSRGGDSFNPTTDVYFGTREDLDSSRFYGGSLDSVQLFNRALSAEEVNDAHTGGSSLATVNVLVNDPPVNSVPGGQSVDEDTTLVFNTANSNLISISDGDAGSNPLRVTLTATNGTMTLSQTTGLTFSTGDGTADATMVFEGTLTNINAALDGLSFLGDQDFNGAANIQIITDDLTLTSLNEDTSQEGYYTFNNTGDLGNDESQGGNDGTVNGAVTNSDATRDNVLEFDGVDDNVQITGLMGSPADVTLAAWVNVDAAAGQGEVISIGNYVTLRVDDDTDGVEGFFWDGSVWHDISANTFIAGTGWHHIAYVFDDASNSQTLYIDGMAVATGNRTESISYSGQGTDTFLGRHGNGSSSWFYDGKIDDARVYDRVLTATEIQNLAFEPTSTDTDNIAITVNATNDTASVTNLSGDTLNYTEGDGAVVIEQGDDVLVTDVDSSDFDTGSLTVAFTAGGDVAEDVLAIRNQGTGAGQIGVSGSNVTYAGTIIGTFTGGSGGTNLVITLNANADPTATTALIKNITYENTDTNDPTTGSRSVRFTLNDGDGGATIRTTTVNVSGQNDAPVLTPSTPTLTTITEDDTGNSGDLISAIVGASITDVDAGAVEGIALTSLVSSNGTWQYDTGSGWTAVGAVTNTSALLLRSTDSLRFVPDAQNADTASVTYRAWDQTSGSAGTKVDVSTNGGTTAFSTATDTASLTVTAVNDAPIITSNGGGATANVNVVEGNTAVTTVTATDVDLPADTLSYSLVGGIDQGFFSIHGGSGILTFNTAPFFASPADANMDNVYEIQVQVNDGNGGMDTQMINVTVTDTNTAPVINSNGGGTTASVNVDEATTAVTTVAATDVDLPGDTLTYSLVGGTDVSRFNINSSTGALTFKTNPDFENPVDADSDNVYHVQVQVSDGNGGTDTQTLNVSVTNIVEAPAPIPEPPPTSEPVPEPTTEPESDPVSEKATDSATSTSQPSLTGPQGTVTPAVISDSAHNQENTAERSGTTFGLGLALQHQLEGLFATHVAEWTSANTIGLNDTLSGPMRMFDIGRSTSVIPIGLEHQLNALAEHLQETIQQNQTQAQIVSGLATGTGVTLSAGYVAWILRGTSLLTSLFASLPAWGNFDPLPVLTGGYTARKAEEIGNQSAAAKENQEYQGIDEIFRDTHQD